MPQTSADQFPLTTDRRRPHFRKNSKSSCEMDNLWVVETNSKTKKSKESTEEPKAEINWALRFSDILSSKFLKSKDTFLFLQIFCKIFMDRLYGYFPVILRDFSQEFVRYVVSRNLSMKIYQNLTELSR